MARNKFGQAIGDIVVRQFGITVRNDIPDSRGKAQRGWQGLGLREEFMPTDEKVSEVSEN